MKKILLCSHTGVFRGGAERSLLLLAKSLVNNYNVTVNIPDNSDELIKELIKENIPYIQIQKDSDKSSLDTLNMFQKITKIFKRINYILKLSIYIKKEKIDTVYLNTLRTTSEFLACKITNTKSLMHLRGFDTKSNLRFKILRYIDKFIVLNDYAKDELSLQIPTYDIQNIHVIPNGVNIYEQNNKKFYLDKIKFVFIGGYEYRKGADYFLDFSKELLNNDFIEIYHIGEDLPKDDFSKEIFLKYSETLNNPRYHELGIINNVQEVISNFDIFIMTSRIEGMPRSLLEAMERNLVSIVSNIPELKNIIKDSYNGLIVDFTKKEETMRTILNTIKNIDKLNYISRNSRKDILDNFDINITNTKITNLLLRKEY